MNRGDDEAMGCTSRSTAEAAIGLLWAVIVGVPLLILLAWIEGRSHH